MRERPDPRGGAERMGPLVAGRWAWEGLLDLVLPADCASCGGSVHVAAPRAVGVRAPGASGAVRREGSVDHPAPAGAPSGVVARQAVPTLCPACATDVDAARFGADVGAPAPEFVLRRPPTWATAAYGGALAHLVVAYKDGGRRDASAVLAPLLAAALASALDALAGPDSPVDAVPEWAGTTSAATAAPVRPGALVVPVPSRPRAVRERGDRPVADLARLAALRCGTSGKVAAPEVVPALVHRRRRVADQAGLGRTARLRNLDHALVVPDRCAARVRGRDVIVIDDVTTSGATLAESARALRAAGAGLVVAAVVAATP